MEIDPKTLELNPLVCGSAQASKGGARNWKKVANHRLMFQDAFNRGECL